jgi:hypothetical protein
LNNRIQTNLNAFHGVQELIDVTPYELPARVVNQPDLFHQAFNLSKAERDARLEELLKTSVKINWNELNNRHRATVDIIAQLDQAITHSEDPRYDYPVHDPGQEFVGLIPGNPEQYNQPS